MSNSPSVSPSSLDINMLPEKSKISQYIDYYALWLLTTAANIHVI